MRTTKRPTKASARRQTKPPTIEPLGIFALGKLNVEVVMEWNDQGGSVYFRPDEEGPPQIRVGMNWKEWGNVVSTLFHEAQEFLLALYNLRFRNCGDWGLNHAEYTFHFNHQDFTSIIDQLAFFAVDILPKLAAKFSARKKGAK